MNPGLREHLEILRQQDKLLVVDREVDLRYASAIIAQTDKAVVFTRPKGYEPQVLVGGLFGDRQRTGIAYGSRYDQAWQRVRQAQDNPIQPIVVDDAPAWEVVVEGDDVDHPAFRRWPIIEIPETGGLRAAANCRMGSPPPRRSHARHKLAATGSTSSLR